MIVLQESDQFSLSAADRIAEVVRILAEEHVKDHDHILVSFHKQCVGHCEFIKIGNHGRVIVIFIGQIGFYFDFTHDLLSPLI